MWSYEEWSLTTSGPHFPSTSTEEQDLVGLMCLGRGAPQPPSPPMVREYTLRAQDPSIERRVCVSLFRDNTFGVAEAYAEWAATTFDILHDTMMGCPSGLLCQVWPRVLERLQERSGPDSSIYHDMHPTWNLLREGYGSSTPRLHPYLNLFGVFCSTGEFANPIRERWPIQSAQLSARVRSPVQVAACEIAGVATLECPINAYQIHSLPSNNPYMESAACPTARSAAAAGEQWWEYRRKDTEIYAFSSPAECSAAVKDDSSTPLPSAMTAQQDILGAYGRTGGDSPDISDGIYGTDVHMSIVPIKRSNFAQRLEHLRNPSLWRPVLRYIIMCFDPFGEGDFDYWTSTLESVLHSRFDDLVNEVLLPRMELRTISGDLCELNNRTWRGLFGDTLPDCYIYARVGTTYEPRTNCFPAGAQLRTANGGVVDIEQIQLGDAVKIITASGTCSYADVHTISHANAEQAATFCYATAAGRNITAECNNFVPAINNSCVGSCDTYAETTLKTMRKLEVGDVIFAATDGTANPFAVVVSAVGTVRLQGLYHLHANVETATLVVDGFVVSELVNLQSYPGRSPPTDGSSSQPHPLNEEPSSMGPRWSLVRTASNASQDLCEIVLGDVLLCLTPLADNAAPANAHMALHGLQSAIEARGDARPIQVGGNATAILTPRAQMGLLRLAHLMYDSLGATLKSLADAKFLMSEWFFKSASETDVKYLHLLGEAFANTADDPERIHLTAQPPLTTEGFTSAVGATSLFHVLTSLFNAGDFFSPSQDTEWSVTEVFRRTGLLAVLSGGNLTVGEFNVTEPTGAAVLPPPSLPSQPPSPSEDGRAEDGRALTSPPPNPPALPASDSATGAIVGGVVGGLAAVFVLIGCVVCYMKKKKAKVVGVASA